MEHPNDHTLLRFIESDLPEGQALELRSRLESDPGLRSRLERVRGMRETLRASAPDSFAPYFSERVMRRLIGEKAVSAYESLRWVFARTAIAGLAIAALLGTLNVLDYEALGVASSAIEAFFGLPSDSLADALSYGSM